MPELPDVEAFREVFESCARSREVERVIVRDTGVLHGVSGPALADALEGRRFSRPRRHGKWLLAPVARGPTLLVHFGMTGLLVCTNPDEPAHAHDRVLFTLAGSRQLRYRDQRKLRGLWLARDAAEVDGLLEGQGPDALSVGRAEFDAALASRRGRLKTALTDQSVLSGLGNLLADEILWRARMRPDTPVHDLGPEDRRRLHTQMRRTLRSALPAGCVPRRDSWLTGHRDDSRADCPRCGARLCRARLSGRGTVWCPRCQPDRS
jgi:formamidopyrimidine-DNA glycosylase